MRCPGVSRVLVVFFPLVLAFGEAGSPEAVTASGSPSTPAIVIGFVGGFVRHDNRGHSTVQVVEHLRHEFPSGVYVRAFENHRGHQAYQQVLRSLDLDRNGELSDQEKQNARIILFGHSWGASETVALARKLQKDGIPVLLTIQVDSVAKVGQNDHVIPANVREAANFYQPRGLVHGQRQIQAADPERTQIVGNYRYDYEANPLRCEGIPWFNRFFMKSHLQIECDPRVWSRVESMIYSRLAPEVRQTASR
jgi:pimeloyl-ACP methyl ester carboxylesterase